jgi:para-nitrobenzyl esterase
MDTVTETTTGRLLGSIVEGGVRAFRGVPFARPPVGPLRFSPPQPADPWTGIRSAECFGNVSHQGAIGLGFMGAGQQTQSEDCLNLNVWTPDLTGRRPVMVWLHGGAFVLGAGSEPLYDGRRLAARGDVVVVTANYRLGLLGYLAHPSLRDDDTGACGNWGLLDQIAAVEWVQANAEAFGGDPTRITVFGESAGSMSVTTMMAAPRANGLFKRVIAQSGAPVVATADEAGSTADRVLHALGGTAAELRDLPAGRLLEVQQQIMMAGHGPGGALSGEVMAFRPNVDGAVLVRAPHDAVADGAASGVELLIGTNRDEMNLFSLLDQSDLDDAGLLARLCNHLDEKTARGVIDTYRTARAPRGEACDPKVLWNAMETDRFFRAPAMRFAAAHAAHGSPTFAYLFCWSSPMPPLGAAHAIELPFVFGTLDAPMIELFAGGGPEAEQLSATVQDAWTAFARTGDPSTQEVGPWPRFDRHERATMVLGARNEVQQPPRAPELACWELEAQPSGLSAPSRRAATEVRA